MADTARTHSTVSLFHLPDPWRTSLIRDELDSSSRAAVAQTCKPGLTWLLSEWPEATLHIPVRPSSALHPVRLQLAREQLALRGGLQTTIAFEKQGEMQPDDWWWETVLPALSTGPVQPNLTLSLTPQYITPELLCAASQALPGLSALHIGCPEDDKAARAQLPQPQELPGLRKLKIDRYPYGAQASLWASVAPYLPQLHSLTIDEQPPAYADTDLDHDLHLSAALCFTPQYTTHTLTHLSLAGRLEPWLAQVLAKHAPALTTLDIPCVMSMQMRPSYRPGHWSVRTLRLGEGAFHTSALTWLPLPAEGKMVVQLSERGTVELPVTTDSKALARHTSISIQGCTHISVQAEWLADDDEDAHFRHRVYTPEQPAALLAALPFIQPLHTPETTLHFGAFTMSPELPAAVAATAEPGWGGVTLGLRDWGMDEGIPYTGHVPHLDTLALEHRVNDELLAEMLAIPFTSVDVFSPFALDLKTPLPLGTQVPWRRVEATSHFGFQDWLRSSHALRHTQSVWQAPDVNFWVKSDIIQSVYKLAEQASQLSTADIDHVFVYAAEDIAQAKDEAAALRAALAILRALPRAPRSLTVHGWTATAAVINELQHVPQWEHLELSLTPYTGRHKSVGVVPGTLYIPHSYASVTLDSMTPTQVEPLVAALVRGRAKGPALSLCVPGECRSWVDSYSGHAHVTVTCKGA